MPDPQIHAALHTLLYASPHSQVSQSSANPCATSSRVFSCICSPVVPDVKRMAAVPVGFERSCSCGGWGTLHELAPNDPWLPSCCFSVYAMSASVLHPAVLSTALLVGAWAARCDVVGSEGGGIGCTLACGPESAFIVLMRGGWEMGRGCSVSAAPSLTSFGGSRCVPGLPDSRVFRSSSVAAVTSPQHVSSARMSIGCVSSIAADSSAGLHLLQWRAWSMHVQGMKRGRLVEGKGEHMVHRGACMQHNVHASMRSSTSMQNLHGSAPPVDGRRNGTRIAYCQERLKNPIAVQSREHHHIPWMDARQVGQSATEPGNTIHKLTSCQRSVPTSHYHIRSPRLPKPLKGQAHVQSHALMGLTCE